MTEFCGTFVMKEGVSERFLIELFLRKGRLMRRGTVCVAARARQLRLGKIFNLRLTAPLVNKMIQESNTKSQPWGRLSTYCTRTLSPAVLCGYGYGLSVYPRAYNDLIMMETHIRLERERRRARRNRCKINH